MEKSAKKKNTILKSGLILSLMTFASRIMGLIREMTKASFLGTGFFADCFTVAFQIPNLLRRLFAENAISVAFIPTFKDYLSKCEDSTEKSQSLENPKKSTQEFINSTFTLVTFLTTIVVIIGILITPFLMPIFCKIPNAESLNYLKELEYWNAQTKEISFLTRIMFPYLFLISVAAFFQGVLNGCKIFSPSGFTPVLFNLIVILATYILSPYTQNPARAMSIGVVLGGTVQAIFQFPFIRKTGWKIGFTSIKKSFTNPGTKKVIRLIVPTIIGMAAYQLNDVVSTSMATRAGEGIAASLQYSLRLQELILGIFAVSIGTVILPDLSGLASKKLWDDFNTMLIFAIKIMILISIPVTAFSLVSGKELISLLYKNKMFDENSVLLTLGEFRFHILGLLFIALNRIISPAFYAQGNTKLPTMAGILSFASNIILVFLFVKKWGGNGIALALSLASLFNTILLFIFMSKMNSFKVKKICVSSLLYCLKITVFSISAVIPCIFLRPILVNFFSDYGRIIKYGSPTLILAIIFAIIGIGLLILTKDEIIKVVIKKIKK